MKKYILASALLLAAGFAASTAQAVSVTANAIGDLILSFRADGDIGASTNLEIDLGSFTTFKALAPGQTISLTGANGLQFSDLSNSAFGYGANWATRTDLHWAVNATTRTSAFGGLPARTLFTTYSSGNAPSFALANSQTAPANTIFDTVNFINGKTSTSDATVNGASGSSQATYVSVTSGDASYTNKSTGTLPFFGYFDYFIEGNTNVSSTPGTLDFYQIVPTISSTPGSATKIGTFTLTSNSFTYTAAPEPASAMLLGASAMTLLFPPPPGCIAQSDHLEPKRSAAGWQWASFFVRMHVAAPGRVGILPAGLGVPPKRSSRAGEKR